MVINPKFDFFTREFTEKIVTFNPVWHKGDIFIPLLHYESDFVSWFFPKSFQTFLEVKSDVNGLILTPYPVHCAESFKSCPLVALKMSIFLAFKGHAWQGKVRGYGNQNLTLQARFKRCHWLHAWIFLILLVSFRLWFHCQKEVMTILTLKIENIDMLSARKSRDYLLPEHLAFK